MKPEGGGWRFRQRREKSGEFLKLKEKKILEIGGHQNHLVVISCLLMWTVGPENTHDSLDVEFSKTTIEILWACLQIEHYSLRTNKKQYVQASFYCAVHGGRFGME